MNYQSPHWKISLLFPSTISDGQWAKPLFPDQSKSLGTMHLFSYVLASNDTGLSTTIKDQDNSNRFCLPVTIDGTNQGRMLS